MLKYCKFDLIMIWSLGGRLQRGRELVMGEGWRFGQLGDCWGIGFFWLRGIKIFFLVEFGNCKKKKILFRSGELCGGPYKYI
jgi:hypothetical protein